MHVLLITSVQASLHLPILLMFKQDLNSNFIRTVSQGKSQSSTEVTCTCELTLHIQSVVQPWILTTKDQNCIFVYICSEHVQTFLLIFPLQYSITIVCKELYN